MGRRGNACRWLASTCGPHLAYRDKGGPGLIPSNAKLVFEAELPAVGRVLRTLQTVINSYPMTHTLEGIIREAYAAFSRGDIDGYLRPCAEDFAFHVPGHGGIAGKYVGKQGLYDLASKAMSITGGTFHEEVEDVLANDDHAVVLARHRFTRDNSLKDYRTAHVYEIRDGKLAQCFEQPRDPASFDDAWGTP